MTTEEKKAITHISGGADRAPVISVVMSILNTSVPVLKEAVDSILQQTFSDFEFIIIDDGSTDEETVAYLDGVAVSDPRVKILRNEVNLGTTKSLNIGFSAARGKYIARMDGDDISFPERFSKQYAFMESHPDVIVCGCRVTTDRNDASPAKGKMEDMDSYRIKMLFRNPGPTHPTAFFRRSVLLEKHIEYDESLRYSQDYGMWAELVKYGRICILQDRLVYYRIHDGQVSKAHREEQIRCDKVTQKKLLCELLGDVTEEELDLHYRYSTLYYRGQKLTKDVRRWYRKLIRANNKMRIYPRFLFRRRVYRLMLGILKRG